MMVIYAMAIAAYHIERKELHQSVAFSREVGVVDRYAKGYLKPIIIFEVFGVYSLPSMAFRGDES